MHENTERDTLPARIRWIHARELGKRCLTFTHPMDTSTRAKKKPSFLHASDGYVHVSTNLTDFPSRIGRK
ncbi:hypothetical protein P4489_01215 [Heyndrickxia sporothermodurans]|nr:hypothetical protein [Heyndrickxia sporothermodurans]